MQFSRAWNKKHLRARVCGKYEKVRWPYLTQISTLVLWILMLCENHAPPKINKWWFVYEISPRINLLENNKNFFIRRKMGFCNQSICEYLQLFVVYDYHWLFLQLLFAVGYAYNYIATTFQLMFFYYFMWIIFNMDFIKEYPFMFH
jgi:hypothetical protein